METIILADYLDEALDRSGQEPMYRQLFARMQQAILSGRLAPCTKLASSRNLVTDLGVGRNTVLHVYDQLTAEGYVESTTGNGIYVADTAPGDAQRPRTRTPPIAQKRRCRGTARG